MTAIYNKRSMDYKITLTRKEAEALAYNYTSYSILLTALECWPDSDSFSIYGSKASVAADLAKALKN